MSDEQNGTKDVEMAAESSQNGADTSATEDKSDILGPQLKFKTGEIVLAKVKGHTPWPAFIIERDALPEQMQASKPKNRDYSVQFINSHDFAWMAEADVKFLEPEVATKNSIKSKTSKALREAFRIAAEQPTFAEYLDQVANAVAEEETPKPKKAKKASGKSTRASRSSAKATSAEVEDENSSLIELKRPKGKGRPSKDGEVASIEDLKGSAELRTELCRQVRNRFQKAFLMEGNSPDLTTLNLNLDQLEQLDTLEVAIIRATKLNKVLRLVSQAQSVDENIKTRCMKFLDRFNTPADPVIRGLPESEVDLKALILSETTETPAPEDENDAPMSDAPMDVDESNESRNEQPKDEEAQDEQPKDEPMDEPMDEQADESKDEQPKQEPTSESQGLEQDKLPSKPDAAPGVSEISA